MGAVGDLLNAAKGNAKMTGMFYIKDSEGGYASFNHDTGEVKSIKAEEIPEGVNVTECDRSLIMDDVLMYVEDTGYNYQLIILKGTAGIPVCVCGFDKPDMELSPDGWSLTGLFSTEKFLGIGTYAESPGDGAGRSHLYGSSMYLEWDGTKYTRVQGMLDDWYAGETDREYAPSEDGQSLVQIH